MFEGFLEREYMGNSMERYLIALGIFIGAQIVLWLIKILVIRRMTKWSERTINRFDDLFVEIVGRTVFPLLYVAAFYISVRTLNLSAGALKALHSIVAIAVTYGGVRIITHTFRFLLLEVWAKRQEDPTAAERQLKGLMPILSTGVWVLGIVFLLDNLGFKISAVVAGLGITGIAVALGAQAVLADLFAYLAIMFDRPFEIDDFIIVGDFMGTVEAVGIKTTRLRSLSGEQIVMANKDLTDSRVRNYKRMQLRRIVFKFGVQYDTTPEQLKKIPAMVKKIVEGVADTRFDRAHFASFDDSQLTFEVVYFVLSADYNKYMDIQQAINLAVKEQIESLGANFAFPTRTLHVESIAPIKTGNSPEKAVG
jgi:small-conductance mechanosensitive channel